MEINQYKYEFLQFLKNIGRTESTLKRYLFDLNDFFLWYEVQMELKPKTIVDDYFLSEYFVYLLDEKNYSQASIKRIHTVLNQYYKFLLEKNLIGENPIDAIHIHKEGLKPFSKKDFVLESETKQLFKTVASMDGLTDKQKPAYPYLKLRNYAILLLFSKYGLTLKELTMLKTKSVNFYQNKIYVESSSSLSRTITISPDDKQTLYQYLDSIQKPVRPRSNTDDPFFVAFDFARNTYRWDYTTNLPKKLTEIAIQKMIRGELKRANLRAEISAQHLRRTAILNALKIGKSPEEINKEFGFKANNSLSRYIAYLNSKEKIQVG